VFAADEDPEIMSAPDDFLLDIRDLRYAVAGRVILAVPAWVVPPGAHSLICGPSGSGKTTLLHLIAGLLRPSAGVITIAGQNLDQLGTAAIDAFRGRRIGIVFQALHLVPALTVADNLRLARFLAGLSRDDGRVMRVLADLDLGGKAGAWPRDLSQGEAQRVAIARAVINTPQLILADEPTSALDDGNCTRVLDLLREQAAACDATLLVATHDHRIKERFDRRLELEARP
jgi:putative ABC transport system ATP-binding protein